MTSTCVPEVALAGGDGGGGGELNQSSRTDEERSKNAIHVFMEAASHRQKPDERKDELHILARRSCGGMKNVLSNSNAHSFGCRCYCNKIFLSPPISSQTHIPQRLLLNRRLMSRLLRTPSSSWGETAQKSGQQKSPLEAPEPTRPLSRLFASGGNGLFIKQTRRRRQILCHYSPTRQNGDGTRVTIRGRTSGDPEGANTHAAATQQVHSTVVTNVYFLGARRSPRGVDPTFTT